MPAAAETALEQTFADLANARLRDKSPALLDYLVGFQLVKANDDGSKAVGIFGFEIGDSWHYAPVFFFNGEIKGLDSLFSVDSDLFVPLNEDWVNQIINRRPNQLGEVDHNSRSERGVRVPNYNRLRQIPSGSTSGLGFNKTSSVIDGMLAMRDNDGILDLPSALKQMGAPVVNGFLADMRRHPKLAEAVYSFYNHFDFDAPLKLAAEKEDKVTIVSNVAQAGADKLSDSEKEVLVTGGVAVVDKRPEMERSVVYRNETKQNLTNPTAGGMYDVLMSDGEVKKLLVFRVAGQDGVLMYDAEDGKHGVMPTAKVFTLRQYDDAEFRKELDKESVAPDAVRARDCVVFCNQTGECSLGFEVESKATGVNDISTLRVRNYYVLDGYMSASPIGYPTTVNHGSYRFRNARDRVRDIIVAEAGSGEIRYLSDKMIVNQRRFRAIVLNKFNVKKNENFGGEYTELDKKSDEIVFREGDFGDHMTVHAALQKVAQPIRVWTDGCEITIKDQFGSHNLTAPNAIGHLMRKHGCSAEDVRLMLKEAGHDPITYNIKYAEGTLPFPDPQDETEGGPMSSFHPNQVHTTQVEKGTTPDNRQMYEYRSPFGGNADGEGQENTSDAVNEAAQTGQKDVFDASVLGAMVKSHNPTDMVERFLPTIVSGMDRLGRLMFLLNWHYEEFQERYGEDDLQEFSDNLKSTFESLGDLVIFMRKRTLSGDPDYFGLGLSSTMQG